ncbi:MAG: hypothetical protein LBJ11_03440 [Oscillospiraceae bacterium]|jgi:hypothetical protein|nr:hypothetical protein [Oscillospiraceae bacterium]
MKMWILRHWGDIVFLPLFLACAYIRGEVYRYIVADEQVVAVVFSLMILFFAIAMIRFIIAKKREIRDFAYPIHAMSFSVGIFPYLIGSTIPKYAFQVRYIAAPALSIAFYVTLGLYIARLIAHFVKKRRKSKRGKGNETNE